jgi:hypothetical protein
MCVLPSGSGTTRTAIRTCSITRRTGTLFFPPLGPLTSINKAEEKVGKNNEIVYHTEDLEKEYENQIKEEEELAEREIVEAKSKEEKMDFFDHGFEFVKDLQQKVEDSIVEQLSMSPVLMSRGGKSEEEEMFSALEDDTSDQDSTHTRAAALLHRQSSLSLSAGIVQRNTADQDGSGSGDITWASGRDSSGKGRAGVKDDDHEGDVAHLASFDPLADEGSLHRFLNTDGGEVGRSTPCADICRFPKNWITGTFTARTGMSTVSITTPSSSLPHDRPPNGEPANIVGANTPFQDAKTGHSQTGHPVLTCPVLSLPSLSTPALPVFSSSVSSPNSSSATASFLEGDENDLWQLHNRARDRGYV